MRNWQLDRYVLTGGGELCITEIGFVLYTLQKLNLLCTFFFSLLGIGIQASPRAWVVFNVWSAERNSRYRCVTCICRYSTVLHRPHSNLTPNWYVWRILTGLVAGKHTAASEHSDGSQRQEKARRYGDGGKYTCTYSTYTLVPSQQVHICDILLYAQRVGR